MRFNQPIGFSLGGFTVGHAATMARCQAVGTIVGVEDRDGRRFVTVEFDEPQPVDAPERTTCKRFELMHTSITSTWTRSEQEVSNSIEDPSKSQNMAGVPKNALELFANEAGHLVEVAGTSAQETVAFAPQGGGFIRTIPRSDFERQFKPAALSAFSLVAISADWLPSDLNVPAYSNGRRWNGWAMPHFTIEAAQSLLKFMPDLRYDSERDAFISAHDGQAEEELYFSVTLVIDGRPIKTYAIGSGCWCWEFAE